MLLKDFEDPFEASWNSQEVVIEEILEEGRDGSNRTKQRCRTETILNTKHRTTQSQGQARMTAGHGRQRSPAQPRRRKNKGQDPKRISSGPSGLLLLQKQPLTYIFRTPSFHERSPQPPKQEQRLKDINNTAGEGFPFRLRQPFPLSASRSSLSRTRKAAGGSNESRWAGLLSLSHPSSPTIGCGLGNPHLLGLRLREGHGSPSHLRRVGGGGVPFPVAAGGRVR